MPAYGIAAVAAMLVLTGSEIASLSVLADPFSLNDCLLRIPSDLNLEAALEMSACQQQGLLKENSCSAPAVMKNFDHKYF